MQWAVRNYTYLAGDGIHVANEVNCASQAGNWPEELQAVPHIVLMCAQSKLGTLVSWAGDNMCFKFCTKDPA